jgi:hypothetical protein
MRLNASHLRRFEADRETIWNEIDAAPRRIPRAAALRAGEQAQIVLSEERWSRMGGCPPLPTGLQW